MCNSDSEFSFYWNFIHDEQPKKLKNKLLKQLNNPDE